MINLSLIFWNMVKKITRYMDICRKLFINHRMIDRKLQSDFNIKYKYGLQEKNIEFPTPGVEPGPAGWKPAILAVRPRGIYWFYGVRDLIFAPIMYEISSYFKLNHNVSMTREHGYNQLLNWIFMKLDA